MTKYGIELYNANGVKTLSINDVLPRFLGYFHVPEMREGNFTYNFPIPEKHRGLGEIFYWFDPSWLPYDYDVVYGYFSAAPTINIDVKVYPDKLVVNVKVDRDTWGHKQPAFMVFYGVR